MYEYNSEKILQRQKVCLKCRSYVTHEKNQESGLICPLCGNVLKQPKMKLSPINSEKMKEIVAQFYKQALAKNKK